MPEYEFREFPLKNSTKNIFNLRCPLVKLNDEGSRLLFVIDKNEYEDITNKMVMSGSKGTTLENMIAYSCKSTHSLLKEYLLVNFSEYSTDLNEDQNAGNIFKTRIEDIIKDYDPDIIIFMGHEPLKYFEPQFDVIKDYGRLTKLSKKINGKFYKFILSFSMDIFGTTDPKYFGMYPHLAGFGCEHITTAINLKNSYNLQTIIDEEANNIVEVDTLAKFKSFYRKLDKSPIVVIDTETSSLNRLNNTLLSIQFYLSTNKITYFLPYLHKDSPFNGKEIEYIRRKLVNYFESNTTAKYHVYHNAKFDLIRLRVSLGVRFFTTRVFDNMAGLHALDENRKFLVKLPRVDGKRYSGYSLELVEHQFGYSRPKLATNKENRASIATRPLKEAVKYASIDVISTYHIHLCLIQEARKRGILYKKFMKLVCEQQSDLIHTLTDIEVNGTPIDREYLFTSRAKTAPIGKLIVEQLEQFRQFDSVKQANALLVKQQRVPSRSLYGGDTWIFNPNKPAHRDILFFQVLKLPALSEGKNKKGRTDKKFQEHYKSVAEVAHFTKYQQSTKLYNTYIKGIWKTLIKSEDAKIDGKFRASYQFTGILTGRLGASDGLHQIPSRGSFAKYIKRQFIAERLQMLIEFDFSAHETRIWGNISGDRKLSDTFRKGLRARQKLRTIRNNIKLKVIQEFKRIVERDGDIHKLNFCVTGDTLIPTSKGLLRIDEITNGNSVKKKIDLEVGGRFSPHRATYWKYSGISPVLHIKTQLGNLIKVTEDHKILTFDTDTGTTTWKKAKDCNRGDILIINNNQPTRQDPLPIHLEKTCFHYNSKELEAPKFMTPDFAFLLGLIISEASITQSKNISQIMFVNSDLALINKFNSLIKEIFNIDCGKIRLVGTKNQKITICGTNTKYTKDMYSISVVSKQLVEWLEILGVYVKKRKYNKTPSHFKRIPWSILQADEKSQLAFMAAYLEGDGGISNESGILSWFSVSKKLLNEFQIMLNSHGASPYYSEQKTCNKISLNREDSKNIWHKLKEFMITKKLYNIYESSRGGIPLMFWKNLIKERKIIVNGVNCSFIDDSGKITNIISRFRSIPSSMENLPKNCKWEGLDYFLNNLKTISKIGWEKLIRLKNQNYTYTKIISITKGKSEKVYDLSIERKSDPSFIANGLVVHNSFFYNRAPKDKTERNSVKSIVFGVTYSKGKSSLAIELRNAAVPPIKEELNKKVKELKELKAKRINNTEDIEKEIKELKIKYKEAMDSTTEEAAQALISLLFEKFKKGGDYLNNTKTFVRENCKIVSKLGRVRHLYGVLHNDRGVQAGADRRASNSDIQGFGSDLGMQAARQMKLMCWHFFIKHGINFSYQHTNTIHDSNKGTASVLDIPMAAYLLEHSMTTRIHKKTREVFGFQGLVDYEVEGDIGPAQSDMHKWDFSVNNDDTANATLDNPKDGGLGLIPIMQRSLTWQNENLKYNLNVEKLMKIFEYNCKVIDKIRRKELQKAILDDKPTEYMYINEDNARELGYKFACDYNERLSI